MFSNPEKVDKCKRLLNTKVKFSACHKITVKLKDVWKQLRFIWRIKGLFLFFENTSYISIRQDFKDLGEDNGTLLQHSCLENPVDGGACWAAVQGSLRVGHDWATSLHLRTSGLVEPWSTSDGLMQVVPKHWRCSRSLRTGETQVRDAVRRRRLHSAPS